MAVVKLDFCKKGTNERKIAKENIKYIENRPDKDGTRRPRTLFGARGQMTREQGYAMVNDAAYGSTFFRIKISPDPKSEDMNRDLLLREITQQVMDIEEQMNAPITWIAAIHDDHTDKRHVHVLAVTRAKRLPAREMISKATNTCAQQRRELDGAREQSLRQERIERERTWQRERLK